MVSVRLCVTPDLVLSCRRRTLDALDDLGHGAEKGRCPATPGDLVARLALRLADRADPVVAALNERVDKLEELVQEDPGVELRAEVAEIRRVSSELRRYMFPQRDALSTLEIEDVVWLSLIDRGRLREATDRVTRLAEELDAIRDRIQGVRDQLSDIRAESMNRRTMMMSVLVTLFAPVSILTGVMGINVGGIPFAGNPAGFWIVCGFLILLCAFQLWLFRRLKIL